MNATQIRKKNQILLLEIKKMTKNIAQIKNETEKRKKENVVELTFFYLCEINKQCIVEGMIVCRMRTKKWNHMNNKNFILVLFPYFFVNQKIYIIFYNLIIDICSFIIFIIIFFIFVPLFYYML